MPNKFITPGSLTSPSKLARLALGVWRDNAVLPSLFDRTVQQEFGGGSGQKVSIRKQASLTANKFNRTNGISVQAVTEGVLEVEVNDIYDVSVEILQEQWDFDITDWRFQVVEPAAKALVRNAENVIAARLAANSTNTVTMKRVATDANGPVDAFIDARKILSDSEVPLDNRFVITGSGVAAEALRSDQFLRTDYAGDSNAFRQAQIGRVLGMPVFESVVIGANEAYVCHRDALSVISLVPERPKGAAVAATESYDGVGFRSVFSYDQKYKKDIWSLDHYLECAGLRGDSAFVKITLAPSTLAASTK
jgi:hypothetical protein